MALAILDGNQSATTLSTILTSGQHIPAHTIVSLGTQAITDISGAVSGSVVSISNLPTTQPISGTVTIGNSVTAANISLLNASVATDGVADGTLNFFKIGGHQSGANQTSHIVHVSAGGSMKVDATDSVVSISNFPSSQVISGTVTANPTGTQTIAGTVTANAGGDFAGAIEIVQDSGNVSHKIAVQLYADNGIAIGVSGNPLPISGTVTANLGSALPAGTNRIGVVTIGAGTVTIGAGTAQIGSVTASISGTVPVSISSVTVGNSVTIGSLPAISGTVTIGSAVFSKSTGSVSMPTQAVLLGFGYDSNQNFVGVNDDAPLPVQIYSAIPAGTNRIGVVTIGAGTVTIGAGTAQIGSVTASISGTVPVSISSVTVSNSLTIGSLPAISGTVTVGNSVTIGSLPAISGTVTVANFPATQPVSIASVTVGNSVTIGSLPAISGTVTVGNSVTIGSLPAITGTVTVGAVSTTVTIAHHQGTSVTTSNFTSTTASTTLASANASREVLTIFNEGAGNLHICAGATCTTIAYQVRLSAGDYYEVPLNQTSLTHSAVFATAGTALVTEIS